jgi:hypothetical protein
MGLDERRVRGGQCRYATNPWIRLQRNIETLGRTQSSRLGHLPPNSIVH